MSKDSMRRFWEKKWNYYTHPILYEQGKSFTQFLIRSCYPYPYIPIRQSCKTFDEK